MLTGRDANFDRVLVDHSARGSTRVAWQMLPGFCASTPVVARLEYSPVINPSAADWTDCGVSGIDARMLVDPVDRLRTGGLDPDTRYRVVLRWGPGSQDYVENVLPSTLVHGTPGGPLPTTLYSPPVPVTGLLDREGWLQAREILRQWDLLFRRAKANRGWVLSKRRSGITPDQNRPTSPVSTLTGEVRSPWRKDTVGTEFLGGYHGPVQVRVLFDPGGMATKRDETRGTVDDAVQLNSARMLAFPPLNRQDLIVIDGSDARYSVHTVKVLAAVSNVALVTQVELHSYPFSDPVYDVQVPDYFLEATDNVACPS
jgi:hypothetical protein